MEIAQALRSVMQGWTVAKAKEVVLLDKLPDDLQEALSAYVMRNPGCATVSADEFTAAMTMVRTDIGAVLTTPDGQAWLQRVPSMMGVSIVRQLFGIGLPKGA